MSYLRRLFEWIIEKAHSRYGVAILFIAAFFESVFSVFPFMLLFIPLIIANLDRAMFYGKVAAIGGILGATVGYFIGYFAWVDASGDYTAIARFFFDHLPGFSVAAYQSIQGLFDKWGGALLVFAAGGFVPIPFSGNHFIGRFRCQLLLLYPLRYRWTWRPLPADCFSDMAIWSRRQRCLSTRYFNWIALGVVASIVIGAVMFSMVL